MMMTSLSSPERIRLAHTAFVQPTSFWRSIDCLQAASVQEERIGILTTRQGLETLTRVPDWNGRRSNQAGRLLSRVREWTGICDIDHPVLATEDIPFLEQSPVAGGMFAHTGKLTLCPVLAKTFLPTVERDMVALVVASKNAAQQMLATRILLDNAELPVMTHELLLSPSRERAPVVH